MDVQFIDELALDVETKLQIADLMKACFPEEDFHGRHYFKQLPHYRLLLKDKNQLIGQLGLDYRVMTLNGESINVLGVMEFAIFPQYQKQGMARLLLNELDQLAQKFQTNIDFIFLVADQHDFYRKFGFQLTAQHARWLVTEEHINYGMKEGFFDDCLMYKQVGTKPWVENGKLDLMGYWY